MCTNYRAPGEDPGQSELRIDLGELWRRTPWDPEVYPDRAAPIVTAEPAEPAGRRGVVAVFGFWPKRVQEARRAQARDAGRPVPALLATVNARAETVGASRLYGAAWRDGQRCLIPARWIYEPNWETGRHVRFRIGLAGWRPFCVAGIWRAYANRDGDTVIGMAMLTVSAEGHPVMSRMHRPGDEKRTVVVVRPDEYDEWLGTRNPDIARSIPQVPDAGDMDAEPAVD